MSTHEWSKLSPEQRQEWLEEARNVALADPGLITQAPAGSRFELPGRKITDLTSFLCAVGEAINGPHGYFGRHLTSFQDCLVGKFGATTPSTFVWLDADASRASLGHAAMARWALERVQAEDFVDEGGKLWLESLMKSAKRGEGPTLFDAIAGVIVAAGWRIELCDADGVLVQILTSQTIH